MHHSRGGHGDVELSRDDLPSGRVPGKAPEPSRSRVDDGDGTFHGFLIGYLGFSVEDVFMGERATSGEPCGPHTMSPRGKGDPRRHMVWGLRGSPPCPLRTPCT